MRANLEHANLENSILKSGNKLGVLKQTLGATFTMDADMPHVINLDPGGSGRTVLLPPEAKGLFFVIQNAADAAELLTVKEDSDTTTIGTVAQNESNIFICDGTTWRALFSDSGDLRVGPSTTEQAIIKGIYMSGNVAVAVPSITDPDIARVAVDISAAFTMVPTVGDAVIAIPQEALPTAARLQGAWVSANDEVEITFGSEGGNVTGASKNFKFLIIDLT